MRLSVLTPIVTRTTMGRARWEEDAGPADLAEIARTADRLGYHHMNCSEHVVIPLDVAPVRGSTYWDPLATFGYLAAQTEHIRFATHVLVLGYHHPLEIAKRYGTLDVVSGGRVILGVGVGSLKEEFDLLGVPFEGRGERADDALAALRASLSRPEPTYDGPYYRYQQMIVDPCAVQERVPLWVGGRTPRSLRRAVTLADGWAPFGITVADVTAMLGAVEVPDGFDVVYGPDRALDPGADPDACAAALHQLAGIGITIAGVRMIHHSLAHYLEQLEALMAVNRSSGPP
ncbi:MAG TPA: TIGR03619 family F420-dependent LLM class oxidoreductase [Acidimicrobiales bacterium]|nr:TIGR03619 family F420-dependent LLM class oxidoreductase [Acidimicrobiales bacterium]